MKGFLLSLIVVGILFVGMANEAKAQCDSCSCAPVRSAVHSVLKNTACTLDKIRPVRRVAAVVRHARPLRRTACMLNKMRPVRRVASAWNKARPVRRLFGSSCCCQ